MLVSLLSLLVICYLYQKTKAAREEFLLTVFNDNRFYRITHPKAGRRLVFTNALYVFVN